MIEKAQIQIMFYDYNYRRVHLAAQNIGGLKEEGFKL